MGSRENNVSSTPKMPPWAAAAKLPLQVPPPGAFDMYNISWTGPIRDNGWLVNVAAIPCARLGDYEEGERARGDTTFPVQRRKPCGSILLNNRYPCKYGKLQGDKRKQRAAQGLADGTKCTKIAMGDSCKKGCPYSFSAKQYVLRPDAIVLKYTLGKCACKTLSPCKCFDGISDAQLHHKNEHGEFIHQDCKDHFAVSDMARAKIVDLLHSKASTSIVQDEVRKMVESKLGITKDMEAVEIADRVKSSEHVKDYNVSERVIRHLRDKYVDVHKRVRCYGIYPYRMGVEGYFRLRQGVIVVARVHKAAAQLSS